MTRLEEAWALRIPTQARRLSDRCQPLDMRPTCGHGWREVSPEHSRLKDFAAPRKNQAVSVFRRTLSQTGAFAFLDGMTQAMCSALSRPGIQFLEPDDARRSYYPHQSSRPQHAAIRRHFAPRRHQYRPFHFLPYLSRLTNSPAPSPP